MKYLKPIIESVDSDYAYKEWQALKEKTHQILIFLGIKPKASVGNTTQGKNYASYNFVMDPQGVAYSMLSIISCVKDDKEEQDETSDHIIRTAAESIHFEGLSIGITDDNADIEHEVINPKNAKEAYEKMINYLLISFNNFNNLTEHSDLIKTYLELNKNYDNKEIITNDFMINKVIVSVSKYKQSYNVVEKIRENNPELYKRMVLLNPDVVNSDNLSQMGFDD